MFKKTAEQQSLTPKTLAKEKGTSLPLRSSPSVALCATALLIDGSSSMTTDDYPPSRIEAAKRGANEYVAHRLVQSPSDLAAVVSFNGDGRVACPWVELRSHHDSVRHAIDFMDACGCTSIGAGLRVAERLLLGKPAGWLTRLLSESHAVAVASCFVKRVILLSDGGHNSGTHPLPIVQRLKAAGVQIDCIGIGARDEVDEELLRKLATSPERYRFIADVRDLFEHYRGLAKSLTI